MYAGNAFQDITTKWTYIWKRYDDATKDRKQAYLHQPGTEDPS